MSAEVLVTWRVPARTATLEIREGDVLTLALCPPAGPSDGDWVIYDDCGEPSIGRWVNGVVFNGRSEAVRVRPKAVVVSLHRSLR